MTRCYGVSSQQASPRIGAVARTFNPKFLMASRAGMRVVAKTMVVSLQEKIRQAPDGVKELDVEPLMKMITLDIFGHVALSTDLGLCKTLTPSPLVKAFEYLLKTTMARMRSPFRPRNFLYCLPVKQNRVHHQERRLIRSFVADLINDKRDSIVDDDKDLLSHLVRAHRDAPGGKLKPEDVSQDAMTDVLMTLLFAGYGMYLSGSKIVTVRLPYISHTNYTTLNCRYNECYFGIFIVSACAKPEGTGTMCGGNQRCRLMRKHRGIDVLQGRHLGSSPAISCSSQVYSNIVQRYPPRGGICCTRWNQGCHSHLEYPPQRKSLPAPTRISPRSLGQTGWW